MRRLLWVPFLLVTSQALADGIDTFARREMRQKNIPGMVVAIVKNGKLARVSAYGTANLETKTPTRPETVFRIASMSKQFTAAAVLLAAREGKLKLDDPITTYLDSLPASWNGVTIRHLLTHTGGIPNVTDLAGFDYAKAWSERTFLEFLSPRPLDFPPGTKFKYSNSGYSLLGWIVERVFSESLRSVLQQRIFTPLEMKSTLVYREFDIVPNRANGYVRKSNRYQNALPVRPGPMDGSGAMLTTAADLAKWEAALLENKILTPAERQLLWTPATLADGTKSRYAFGTYSVGDETYHTGSTPGFTSAYIRRFKDRLTVIVLRNSGADGSLDFARRILGELSKP